MAAQPCNEWRDALRDSSPAVDSLHLRRRGILFGRLGDGGGIMCGPSQPRRVRAAAGHLLRYGAWTPLRRQLGHVRRATST